MTAPDPLISDLHAVIARIASQIIAQPDWLLRDVSPADRAFVERIFELAVLIHSGRTDVIH